MSAFPPNLNEAECCGNCTHRRWLPRDPLANCPGVSRRESPRYLVTGNFRFVIECSKFGSCPALTDRCDAFERTKENWRCYSL